MGARGRVVITGMGAVAPNGVGVRAFAAALRRGESGVHAYTPDDPRVRTRVAATVGVRGANAGGAFDPVSVMGSEVEVGRLPRLVPMGVAAASEALEMARWQRANGPKSEREELDEREVERSRRIGLVLGTGGGGIDFTLDQFQAAQQGKVPSLWTITNATHGNLAGELSIRLGLRGPSYCVSTGCASSSDAVGMGLMMLRSGGNGLDAVVVVGADAHVRWETLYTMELLRVISTRDWAAAGEDPATASRPFDRRRDGFVLGEGAWAVVLERAEHARRREARVIGEVLGYAATCDAYHRVRPAPDMAESARAMRTAVADAGLEMEGVEVVHYHGTSTKLNDALETAAVKLAFGARHAARLRGHSVKSMIGHPQGACGLAALVATLAGLTNQDGGAGAFVHPTANLRERDPECDLEYTAVESRETSARVALINCLAFGAKNSAIVVRAGEVSGTE